ncbi:MAG TPA: abscisic acid-deficient protein Aba4 family protein [Allosphingosinicella sp.]|jgi:hypothetical protein
MLNAIFLLAQGVQLIGLLALFALPVIGRRRAVIAARAAAGLLAVGYLFFFLPHAAAIPRDMGYSLDAVAEAFSTRELLLAGWIHYLVLDLFACSWEAEDAERSGVGYGTLALCMFVTAMVAPLGLLLYFIVARTARRRSTAPRR